MAAYTGTAAVSGSGTLTASLNFVSALTSRNLAGDGRLMRVDYFAQVTLGQEGTLITNPQSFHGEGRLTAQAAGKATVQLGGEGLLGASTSVALLQLAILDNTLYQAPTTVTVTVTGGRPNTPVEFAIDGEPVFGADTDATGGIASLPVPVPEVVGAAGTHTITASQVGSAAASATFTLEIDPAPAPTPPPPDADPTDVPGSVVNGVRRWVFQDPMPGGLGSYIFPNNPSRMTSPHCERQFTVEHTTAQGGQFHVFEAGPKSMQWSFSGYCGTQEFHDKLVAFGELNRRIYVIDHRGRSWTVAILNTDMVARRRQTPRGGVPTDWGHDYTITTLIFKNWMAMP